MSTTENLLASKISGEIEAQNEANYKVAADPNELDFA